MADRFFVAQEFTLGEVVLAGPEAHHLAVVRRFIPGDHVVLFNGDGYDYPAEVLSATKKSVVLIIQNRIYEPRSLPYRLVVAAALPKADRADFLIEKCTELGVTEFLPLTTERSIVVPRPALLEKFQRHVIEASKQCGRNELMKILSPLDWSDFLKFATSKKENFGFTALFHTSAKPFRPPSQPHATLLAIGPEGGFTPSEVAHACEAGIPAFQFGARTLRLETAALVATTATIHAFSSSGSDNSPVAS